MAVKEGNVYLGGQIPKELHEELVEISKKTEVKISGLVRLALKEYVATHKKKSK